MDLERVLESSTWLWVPVGEGEFVDPFGVLSLLVYLHACCFFVVLERGSIVCRVQAGLPIYLPGL